jgi:ribosomal protein S18 acetylase RimI-like enzyme
MDDSTTTMDDAITYRAASEEDLLTICRLGQLLNAVHHAERPDIYTQATLDHSRDLVHWKNSFASPAQVVFIAHAGVQPAGFITASLSSSTGPLMQPMNVVRIGSVCVAEQFWGNGIGRGLVQHVRDWAVQRQAEDIRLAVWTFNEHAIRLYSEIGFETRALEMGMRI